MKTFYYWVSKSNDIVINGDKLNKRELSEIFNVPESDIKEIKAKNKNEAALKIITTK